MNGDSAFAVAFDFDGTVCLGDGPVKAYAEAVCAHLDRDDAAALNDELERFLACPVDMPKYSDAYDVVQAHAAGRLTAEQSQDAYLRSRRMLAEGTFDVRPPEGLESLLERLGVLGCRRVLVTNSPMIGLCETLDRLGVLEGFDGIIAGAAKPGGWPKVIERLSAVRRRTGELGVMSIGDYWTNDIAPVRAAGGLTAFIHEPDPSLPATITAPTLRQMVDDIVDVCAAASADAGGAGAAFRD